MKINAKMKRKNVNNIKKKITSTLKMIVNITIKRRRRRKRTRKRKSKINMSSVKMGNEDN